MAFITKEKNGTYTLRYSVKDPISGTTKEKKKRGFRTKTEAKEFERSLSRSGSDVLFYTLFKEFMSLKDVKEETRTDADHVLKKYIPALEYLPYEKLTKPYLIELRQHIAELDLSARRKNKLVDIIKGTCNYANSIYDLDDNSRIMKRFQIVKKDITIWNIDEYEKFEQAVKESYPDYLPFFRLLYFTGMRKGEARALFVEDLDIDNATVSINKAMRRDASSLGATKNAQSVRKIKIDEYTLELLKPLKSHEKWLFGDYKPMSNSCIQRAFNNSIKKAGISKIRIHDLRHSHLSYLLGNGIDVTTAAARAGHSSITTTLNTYSHVLNNADEKVLNLLNTAISRPVQNEKPHK